MQGYRHFFTNKPIRKPDDLKGLHPHAARADLAGVDPRARRDAGGDGVHGDVPGPAAEGDRRRRARLQQHPRGKFYEVLKFANETKHIMLINFEVVSAKWFNSLPKDMQEILVEECDKAGEATSRKIFELEAQVEQDLKKRGMTVVEDVDLAAFRKAGERAYEVLKIQDAKRQVHKEIGK